MTDVLAAALSTLVTPAPLPRTRYTSGQCWFEISGHLAVVDHGEVGMHGFTVQCGPNTVLHAYGTANGLAGAVLNIQGDYEPAWGPVHARQLSVPISVKPEDALIVTSTTTAMGSRGPLPYPGGRSDCDEMLPVVFVSWVPSSTYLRPPAIGNSDLARFLRSIPVPISALDLSRLPSVINIDTLPVNWADWGHAKPTVAKYEALFARFCGEVYTTWSTDTGTPDWQNVGYGREQACTASVGLCLLASTMPVAQKAKLARNMAQRGFDLLGAMASGRQRLSQCNGGHGNGRKALVILLGHLLGNDIIRNVSGILGPCYAEDFQYVQGSRFDGGNARWRYNSTGDESENWANPPEQWSAAWVWEVNGYFPHCCGSQIGTALFMRLTGNIEQMGRPFDDIIAWWMSRPAEWLRGPNVRWTWGEDYSPGEGGGFCAAAWRAYAG